VPGDSDLGCCLPYRESSLFGRQRLRKTADFGHSNFKSPLWFNLRVWWLYYSWTIFAVSIHLMVNPLWGQNVS
jgi:hypothetical protein